MPLTEHPPARSALPPIRSGAGVNPAPPLTSSSRAENAGALRAATGRATGMIRAAERPPPPEPGVTIAPKGTRRARRPPREAPAQRVARSAA
jgi:hypothetical protein